MNEHECATEGHDFEVRTRMPHDPEPLWLACRHCQRTWRIVDGKGGHEPEGGVFDARSH
jgi:hypothetical protein